MEYRKFEEHISESLSKDEVYIDISQLINDIHDKEKKRNSGLWIWLAGIGLIALGLTSFIMVKKVNTKPPIAFSTTASPADGIKEQAFLNEGIVEQPVAQGNFINAKVGESAYPGKMYLSNESKSDVVLYPQMETVVAMESKGYPVIETSVQGVSLVQKINRNSESIIPLNDIVDLVAYKRPFDIGKLTGKIACPDFSNRSRLLIDIIPEAGLFIPSKKLENTSVEGNSIFDLRKKDEKSLEGINAGLYLRLRKEKSPFYIKAGVSYSKLTERMDLKYAYTRKDTTQGVISITVSQTGDTITTIYGDIITDRKISGNKVRHYSFSMIDMPVALGVEKEFGSWTAGLEAGAVFNLSLRTSGTILASDTSFVAADLPSANFRQSLGVSYFAGVTLGKDIFRAGRLYLAARARFMPDAFSGDQNRIKQSYNFFGINAGYIYTF